MYIVYHILSMIYSDRESLLNIKLASVSLYQIHEQVSLFKNKPSKMSAFKENLWLKISYEKY